MVGVGIVGGEVKEVEAISLVMWKQGGNMIK